MHYQVKASRCLLLLAFLIIIGYVSRSLAQDQSPEQANRALVEAFYTAWNRHAMLAMDKLLTDDVDWIDVSGGHGKGRDAIVKAHVKVHATVKFKDSVATAKSVDVVLLRPDVALVHIDWAIRGDRDLDGTPREPREGILTWVTVNDGGTWKIRASHNTNKTPIK